MQLKGQGQTTYSPTNDANLHALPSFRQIVINHNNQSHQSAFRVSQHGMDIVMQ
jgi:hypothetical protein